MRSMSGEGTATLVKTASDREAKSFIIKPRLSRPSSKPIDKSINKTKLKHKVDNNKKRNNPRRNKQNVLGCLPTIRHYLKRKQWTEPAASSHCAHRRHWVQHIKVGGGGGGTRQLGHLPAAGVPTFNNVAKVNTIALVVGVGGWSETHTHTHKSLYITHTHTRKMLDLLFEKHRKTVGIQQWTIDFK